MKHAVIVAHPSPKSFTQSVAAAYRDAAAKLNHQVVVRDLYQIGFDPCLQDGEIPRPSGFAAASDVMTERGTIADADVFALVYPLWFNVPPAILTGYVQRVFGMGFGYGPFSEGRNKPLLYGRRLISFSSSGAPTEWLRTEGAWDAIRTLFDQHLADVCGMSVADHRHYGRVLSLTPPTRIEAHLEDVARTVAKLFSALPERDRSLRED